MAEPARSDEGARRALLAALGASPESALRVLDYAPPFDAAALARAPDLPLPDELPLTDWRRYDAEAPVGARFEYLAARLPQLEIPIRDGVSTTEEYAAVMRRGAPFEPEDFGGRFRLVQPEAFHFYIHEHPAGALPVLASAERRDFEALWRALACRGEPRPLGPSVNAQMIAGITNWDRVHGYLDQWLATGNDEADWPAEMGRVARAEPERFFDRIMLVGVNAYSGVAAADLGLAVTEEAWVERSMALRVEHEFTHYATKRLCGQMRTNLLDELIADCMGTAFALGEVRARWLLRFLGLDRWPEVRADGRVHAYRADLDDPAFALVCAVVVRAAAALERLAHAFYRPEARGRFLRALMSLTLETLAGDGADAIFAAAWGTAGERPAPPVAARSAS